MLKRLLPFALVCLLLVVTAMPAVAAKRPERYKKTVVNYEMPDVTLINQDREKVKLVDLINGDEPILLDFIYATCTTICPVLSAGFSNMQKKLDPASFRLISLSIDPQNDTPEAMAEYLQRYRAQPGWDFLTGTREDIDLVMKAFDAYVPDKMEHYPITFLRYPDKHRWARLYGLIGTGDLLKEYHSINGQ